MPSSAQSPSAQTAIIQRPGSSGNIDLTKQGRELGGSQIRLNSLPTPPTEIAKLIRQGSVKLFTGGTPWSNPNDLPPGIRLAGETRFTFRYRYNSHAQWRKVPRRSGDPVGESMMLLRVRFRSVKLFMDHVVWIRSPKPPETFWQDLVVKHEFDHVRISSDPRIENMFLKAVRALETSRVPASDLRDPSGAITDQSVRDYIESQMKAAMQSTSDYASIRYRELDRLTNHGMKPIPEDASETQEAMVHPG